MQVDRGILSKRLVAEHERFVHEHPRSRGLAERARGAWLQGVPMHWMVRWAGAFPIFVRQASGAHFTDVDGLTYLDLCLGDTGAMAGHSHPAVTEAVAERLRSGVTFMLPTEDALWVGEELQRRFGLPYWQMATTATDANRFVLRLARRISGRPKVLVFNGCYHGTVDETFATLAVDGAVVPRAGNLGPPVPLSETTKVVEWNDVAALERALAPGDVACVLAEPALTNIGIVHPAPGFHAALREITRRAGTLLVLDETHTISAGAGGCTRAWGLEPDFFTLGKPIGGGVPTAVYGCTHVVGERIAASIARDESDTGGIGGTLAGNALSMAAMRATLGSVLTEAAYEHTVALGERFAAGVRGVIDELDLPWNVTQLGCRVEYAFRSDAAHNGGEAAAALDPELDRYLHLAMLNRGILMTPFHNMALIAPSATAADVDRHTALFREIVQPLVS